VANVAIGHGSEPATSAAVGRRQVKIGRFEQIKLRLPLVGIWVSHEKFLPVIR